MSFIGIDVAKAQLEFACQRSGDTGTVPNTEAGACMRKPLIILNAIARSGTPWHLERTLART